MGCAAAPAAGTPKKGDSCDGLGGFLRFAFLRVLMHSCAFFCIPCAFFFALSVHSAALSCIRCASARIHRYFSSVHLRLVGLRAVECGEVRSNASECTGTCCECVVIAVFRALEGVRVRAHSVAFVSIFQIANAFAAHSLCIHFGTSSARALCAFLRIRVHSL